MEGPVPMTISTPNEIANTQHSLSRSELAVGLGASFVAVILPTVLWSSLFVGSTIVVPTAAGAALALAWAMIVGRLRWSWPVSTLGFVALSAAGLTAWFEGDIDSLAAGVRSCWKAVASTGLLLPVTPELAMVPLLVSAIGGWIAFSTLLRGWPAAINAAALVSPTGVALAYASSQAKVGPVYAAVLACLITVVLLAARPRVRGVGGTPLSVGRSMGTQGLALVAAAALIAGAASLGLQNRLGDPFDLRERVIRPVSLASGATPVSEVRKGLLTEDQPVVVFSIQLIDPPPDLEVSYLPVAILDQYDGSFWASSDRFEPAGSVLAPPKQRASTVEATVGQTVVIHESYPFIFLPRIGEIVSVGDGDFVWDADSGVLASDDEEQRRFSFDAHPFEASSAVETVERGDDASGIRRPSDAQAQALTSYLETVITAEDSLAERLSKIEADMRTRRFEYNPDVPAGHSLPILVCYLSPSSCSGSGASDRRVGHAEQSASAFAVLAGRLGASVRLVVGYRLTTPLSAEAPEQDVTAHQVHTWPEIWTDADGWVRYEPTNPDNRTTDLPSRALAISDNELAAALPAADLSEPLLLPPDDEAGGFAGPPWWWFAASLPPLYLLFVWSRKWWRSSRRRRQSKSADRLLGAWLELRDRLRNLGLPVSPSTSVADLSGELLEVDLRAVAEPVQKLGPLVDLALYSNGLATAEHSNEAWLLSDQAIKLARRETPARSRVLAWLKP